MKKKITNQELIERFKKIHGNKYNYSRVDYISMHTKVCIICPIHGEFWQTPHNHLKGQNCQKCANIVREILLGILKKNLLKGQKQYMAISTIIQKLII